MALFYLLLALSLVSVYVCYRVAKERGAAVTYWVVMAILLGPIVIPFVFFAKPEHQDD